MPPKRSGKEFQWTDDEVELLLNVTYEYKTSKAAESTDWESVKSKYSDIFNLFKEGLPESDDERREIGEDYSHKKEEVSRQALTSKLKAIHTKYRQAVDSGRRSGHGRVVMLYFELCERVWGGSPATEQISSGLETADHDDDSTNSSVNSTNNHSPATEDGWNLDAFEEEVDSNPTPSQATVQHRRELLSNTLADHRQKKLKRKLLIDAQLLDCAKEDMKIKKQLIDRMEHMDKQYMETMTRLSSNMEKIVNSIANGFSLLKNTLYSAPNGMYSPSPPGAYNPGLYPPMQGSFHMFHPFNSPINGQPTSVTTDVDLQDPTM